MTALMYAGKAMGMPMDMPRLLGLMVVGPEYSVLVYALGLALHLTMGAVFGVLYALNLDMLGLAPTVGWGAFCGLVHGGIAGLMMGAMPNVHPRMGPGQPAPTPGLFGKDLGAMVPAGLVALHVVFGAAVGYLLGPA